MKYDPRFIPRLKEWFDGLALDDLPVVGWVLGSSCPWKKQ